MIPLRYLRLPAPVTLLVEVPTRIAGLNDVHNTNFDSYLFKIRTSPLKSQENAHAAHSSCVQLTAMLEDPLRVSFVGI